MGSLRLVRSRAMHGVSLLVVTTVSALVFAAAPRLRASVINDGSAGSLQDESKPSRQEPIPPDHYDPDDVKTYPDVLTEDRLIAVRGQEFMVHFYRPRSAGPATPAIYACGDGGWRGLAPRTAQELAHIGLAVAGVDSKLYLRQFSSVSHPLSIAQLAMDYSDIAKAVRSYADVDSKKPVYVYGWSLGAGFAIAIGSDSATRENWAGIISIGLPKQNQLVSGVGGNHLSLSSEQNSLYAFRSQDVIPAIAPLPLMMIQSTSDTASPPKVGRELFSVARDPKQYVLIRASNHRFTGARGEFYAALGSAVSWVRELEKGSNRQTAAIK